MSDSSVLFDVVDHDGTTGRRGLQSVTRRVAAVPSTSPICLVAGLVYARPAKQTNEFAEPHECVTIAGTRLEDGSCGFGSGRGGDIGRSCEMSKRDCQAMVWLNHRKSRLTKIFNTTAQPCIFAEECSIEVNCACEIVCSSGYIRR